MGPCKIIDSRVDPIWAHARSSAGPIWAHARSSVGMRARAKSLFLKRNSAAYRAVFYIGPRKFIDGLHFHHFSENTTAY